MSLTFYHTPEKNPDTRLPDTHQDTFSKTYFGFWVYLMTDCLLFAGLFATYAVLHRNTFGGPSAKDLFDLPTPFFETIILLTSSLTSGFAVLASLNKNPKKVIGWLTCTFVLGALFVATELHEFNGLLQQGHSWQNSAFLSSFFTLVGTHGLHVSTGLLWILVLVGQLSYQGINVDTFRRLVLFTLFWHFLDLIWIFIFTFVYLLGMI